MLSIQPQLFMSVVQPTSIEVQIQFNSCYCGVDLNSLQLPNNCQCLGIVRNKKVILASENPTISCGDYILAVALFSGFAPELEFTLKKTHPVLWSSFRSQLPSETVYKSNEDFFTQLCCKD